MRIALPKLRPLPVATLLLTAACLGAFALELAQGGNWRDVDSDLLLRLGAGHAPAIAAGELWRVVVSPLLHGNALHLLINLAALVEIGAPVERVHGPLRTLAIFLVAGAAGAVASAAWDRDVISIGASGAIFGLFAFWLRLHWRRGNALAPPVRRWQHAVISVFALFALGAGFLIPGVDNVAHLAGLIAGFALAWAGLGRPSARHAFWRALALLAAIVALGAFAFPAPWGESYADGRRFERRYRDFAHADRQATEVLRRIGRDAQAGRIGDDEALRLLDAEVLPILRRLVAGWQNERFAGPAEADRRVWLRYAELRMSAVLELRQAAASGDEQAARRFEQRLSEAATVVASLGQRRQK